MSVRTTRRPEITRHIEAEQAQYALDRNAAILQHRANINNRPAPLSSDQFKTRTSNAY